MDAVQVAAQLATQAAPGALGETVEVQEGRIGALLPKNVFYNPAQVLNRDLTICVLNESAAAGPVRILEALAASGLRAARFAKEVHNVKLIVANDYDETACSYIRENARRNGVSDLVTATCQDASSLMYSSRRYSDRFDVVDLDPYGSPVMFLDAAVQCVKDDGLLCVTATDMAILCGNCPETAFSKYRSVPVMAKFCHEFAIRIVLFAIETAANKYSRYIIPVLSVSIDFYVRVFVRVRTQQSIVKESITKIGHLFYCHECHSQQLQPQGEQLPAGGGQFKYKAATLTLRDGRSACSECGSGLRQYGPVWLGQLHDGDFVQRVASGQTLAGSLKMRDRIAGLLALVLEELPDRPLYYVLDELCKTVHCVPPTLLQFNSALLHAGFRVSLSHAARNSIKTDAPAAVLFDILRAWTARQPVAQRHRLVDTASGRILARPPFRLAAEQVLFDRHPHAEAPSKLNGLKRFPLNPEPNWGPKPKAKRLARSDDARTNADTIALPMHTN